MEQPRDRKADPAAGTAAGSAAARRNPMRICVLLGGDTGERDVSISSGLAVAGGLLGRGHRVLLCDPAGGRTEWGTAPIVAGSEEHAALARRFAADEPRTDRLLPTLLGLPKSEIDVVAILLHGGAGEGGPIQTVLELLGLPYTGSPPAASALALDKVLAKAVMRSAGIPLAEELLWRPAPAGGAGPAPGDAAAIPPPPSHQEIDRLGGYPLVVKPICGGSTIGLTIVEGPEDWEKAWRAAAGEIDPRRGLLVEQYVPGLELTVSILGERALPVIQISPKTGFYDYRRKYTKGETVYTVPAPIPEEAAARLQAWAVAAHEALGCRDVSRIDFRLAPDGRAVCLEVNTIPGMTATSLVPMAAAATGMPFDVLAETLCFLAKERGARI